MQLGKQRLPVVCKAMCMSARSLRYAFNGRNEANIPLDMHKHMQADLRQNIEHLNMHRSASYAESQRTRRPHIARDAQLTEHGKKAMHIKHLNMQRSAPCTESHRTRKSQNTRAAQSHRRTTKRTRKKNAMHMILGIHYPGLVTGLPAGHAFIPPCETAGTLGLPGLLESPPLPG